MKKTLLTLLAASALLGMAAYAQEEKKADAPKAEAREEADDKAEAAPAEEKAESKPAEAKASKDYVIIRLGSEEIKNSEAEELWKSLFPGGTAPEFSSFDENIRQNVLRGMVSERLIYAQAVKDGFDKSPEVRKRLENLKKQLIMQAFMENKAKELVTDDALKAAYAEKIAALKNQEEVHARHILVPTEEEAKTIAREVKKGGDFEKIAKEKSSDKGSGAQGGDLGWFTRDKMVPEFAEAAFKMKKGDISDPVKTSFGWHVIKIEERRKVRVPSLDEMREELTADISNKAVQSYVESLLKKSDIKYYGPDGKPRDFSLSMDQKKE